MTLAISPLGREALDQPGAPRDVVEVTLRGIARANTWLGGRAAVSFGLDLLLNGDVVGRRLTLLDVGAGSGDLAHHLVRHAARRGVTLAPFAVERHPVAARVCRETGVPAALGSGGQLPLASRSVDIVLASQLLHHLTRDSGVTVIRELDRVARLGVIIADLRRHLAAALGFWLASYGLRLDAVTRRDGVTSVRRGFTRAELGALIHQAGVRGAVYRRPGFRLVAVWRAAREDG